VPALSNLFATGRVVDAILVLMAIEWIAFGLLRDRTGRGPNRATLAWTFASGGALLLALRAALVQAAWEWIALCLLASLLAHVLDVHSRSRAPQ
jgi:uncharacterized membrane protein YhhN